MYLWLHDGVLSLCSEKEEDAVDLFRMVAVLWYFGRGCLSHLRASVKVCGKLHTLPLWVKPFFLFAVRKNNRVENKMNKKCLWISVCSSMGWGSWAVSAVWGCRGSCTIMLSLSVGVMIAAGIFRELCRCSEPCRICLYITYIWILSSREAQEAQRKAAESHWNS